MGKGDRKSKRGKIWRGSHGNSRPKQKNIKTVITEPSSPKKASEEKKEE